MLKRRFRNQEADLDITSFMNLMIILVPVLLMSMVFAHTSVLDLKLPDLASDSQPSNDPAKESLELLIMNDEMVVAYPAGVPLKRIAKIADPDNAGASQYDYALLSDTLQEVKRQLKDKGIDKKDILILSQPDTDYQTIVKAMDTVRSFRAVVAASLVDAELFPQISLGDAPANNLPPAKAAGGGK